MDPLSGSWMGVAVPEREIFGAPIDWTLEFKSTIRMNLKTEKFGKEIELAWLKSATAFTPLIRFQVQPIVSKLVVAVQRGASSYPPGRSWTTSRNEGELARYFICCKVGPWTLKTGKLM